MGGLYEMHNDACEVENIRLSQDHALKAETALNAGDRVAAMEHMEKAAAHAPSDDGLALMAAMLRFENGEYADAARRALDAVRVRPFNPPGLNLLAVACIEGGYPDLAVRVLRKLLRMAPGLKIARRNLKDARRRANRGRGKGSQGAKTPSFPTREVAAAAERPVADLTACVVVHSQDADPAPGLSSLAGTAAEVVVLDARPDPTAPLAAGAADATILRTDPGIGAADAFKQAMGAARSGWVLFLGENETIADDTPSLLESFLQDTGALYHPVTVRKGTGPAARWTCSTRLLRNAPRVAFEEGSEPTPLVSLRALQKEWGLEAGEPGVVIDAPKAKPVPTTSGRAAVLEAAHADLRAGRAAEALETARRVRREMESDGADLGSPELEAPVVLEGACLLRLGRYGDLADTMRAYNAGHPVSANTLFLEGFACKALGRTRQAADLLRGALDVSGHVRWSDALPETIGAGLPNLLGAALLDARDVNGAEKAFQEAIARDPDGIEAPLGLICVRAARQQIRELLEELDVLVAGHGEKPQLWQAGGIVLSDIPGMGEAAVAWLQEGTSRFPEDPVLREKLGSAHLGCGQADDALRVWDGRNPADLSARVAATLIAGGEFPEVPPTQVDAVGAGVIGWFERWLHNEAAEVLEGAIGNASRAEEVLPGFGASAAAWVQRVSAGTE